MINVLLIKQNRELKAELLQNQPELLQPGQKVPTFSATNTFGEKETVNYKDFSKTVFFVFSPQCSASERISSLWREVWGIAANQKLRAVGINIGDRSEGAKFLETHKLHPLVLHELDSSTKDSFMLRVTPLTIVVNSEGIVERGWVGAIADTKRPEFEAFFGISVAGQGI